LAEQTYKGNEVHYVKIRDPAGLTERKSSLVVGGMQAEPIAVYQAMHTITTLLDKYENNDPSIINLLKTSEVVVIPALNIDSYKEVTGLDDEVYPKNLNDTIPCASGEISGVNLNNNWGYKWGVDEKGSSGDPCHELYRGEMAWSEAETSGVKDLLGSVTPAFYISYHAGHEPSYIFPYAYDDSTTEKPEYDVYYKDLSDYFPSGVKVGSYRKLFNHPRNGVDIDYFAHEYKAASLNAWISREQMPIFEADIAQIHYDAFEVIAKQAVNNFD
jgi:hypothetical protein